MTVHTIYTTHGRLLQWYEDTGIVSFQRRLYFTRQNCTNQTMLLQRTVQQNALLTKIPATERADDGMHWPTPNWAVVFHIKLKRYPTKKSAYISDHVSFSVERTWMQRRILFIDEINPALRRLQRWFRSCVRRKRWQEASLAFLMGTNPRLGEDSPVSSLLPELRDLIIHKLK